jgi:hypothetical protein
VCVEIFLQGAVRDERLRIGLQILYFKCAHVLEYSDLVVPLKRQQRFLRLGIV